MDGQIIRKGFPYPFTFVTLIDGRSALRAPRLAVKNFGCCATLTSMQNKPPGIRTQLLNLLENWLEADEGEALDPKIRNLFEITVLALKDLDHGETPEIFRPIKSKRRGSRPAEVRHLELWALRSEAALVRNKYMNKTQARQEIAEAYGKSVELLKTWAKDLKAEPTNSSDFGNELATILSEDAWIESAHRKMGRPKLPVEHILELSRQHGQRYRQLRPGTKKGHGP